VRTPDPLIDGLNGAQREAVLATDGPLLILAGAGAGKTRVITHRIAEIIRAGKAAPHEILAVTFTNKAAKEMRERVAALLSGDERLSLTNVPRELPFVSTFHSLGVHIIKENAGHFGLTRHFTIYDRDDSRRAVKAAIIDSGFDPKELEPRRALNAISRAKGDGMGLTEYRERFDGYFENAIAEIWEKYDAALRKEKALDFDDLLLKTVELLRREEKVRERYQRIWKYIHVDEYQDTNVVQYELIRWLAAGHQNLCVVGDIDQNIYSWRGATIENIFEFEREYPEARVVLLTENYRSTKIILEASNAAIAKNRRRKEKVLTTENPDGEKIALCGLNDEMSEARFVATKSRELMRRGAQPDEIAVLYRANFQSRALEEAFLAAGLPHQVLGTRFFERKEVKDVISYLRAALNPESTSDIARIANVPVRGIGKVTLLAMLENRETALAPGAREKVLSFKHLLSRMREVILAEKASDVLRFVVRESGIERALAESGTEEDSERLENVKELVTLATKYDGYAAPEGIEKLIEEAALQSDQDELREKEEAKKKPGVTLMTVHAAKGLEFEYVFITGLEDGLFPHERDDESADDEEERRLFYVALTRAKKRVFLSYALTRRIFGTPVVGMPSEFITEMDPSLVEVEQLSNGYEELLPSIS
jgi:DNA helicase-2/ATP-dependent DNA helicase PcrA